MNGEEIPEERVAGILTSLKPVLEKMVREGQEQPTEFEVDTALAFLYFREAGVQLSILEVGLGGAIDSTNVVPSPLVSVITNVGRDHMQYLGESIAEIASVKAGIIKEGRPLVTAARRPEAYAVLEKTCREKNSSLFLIGRDVTWVEEDISEKGQIFHLQGLTREYRNLFLPLLGRHQQENAAVAVTAVDLLEEEGFQVKEAAVREGLANTIWPGRLEVLFRRPTVLVDVAHNHDGAVSLRRALSDFFSYNRLILMVGMLADKERDKVMAELAPLASAVVVTKPLSPRAGDWERLAEEAGHYLKEVYLVEEMEEALEKSLALAGEDDLLVLTGSFYTVAAARELALVKLRYRKEVL